ncbi:ATP-dependent DNA helicase [Bacillus sp. TS-2]|nr:ATP-dependent DNA helicase [Bacillus sp. TS-2]
MQTAYFHQKIIHLPFIDRSTWQSLYKASLHGHITCIHCGKPLRLEIPIYKLPEFLHPNTLDPCQSEVEPYEKNMLQKQKQPNTLEEKKTIQGFRLPSKKEIKTNHSESSLWKEPEILDQLHAYQKLEKEQNQSNMGYRFALEQKGIMFDENQWSAVKNIEGHQLILAGAGSGKTRVLTARTAYMIAEKGINPKEIILVTFTAKAAKEMKERMTIYPGLSPHSLQQLMVGTFHSIFYKILAHHSPEKWHSSKLLKANWQREQMIKEASREMNIDEKDFAFDQALTQISWWKNHLLSPHQIKPKDYWEEQTQFLYERYEEKRKSLEAFDFDDMLLGCYELFQNNEALLKRYQQRFHYVSIDEYQDINKVQADIMTMLTQKSGNLCVVGDDDQSIYSFRGSNPNYILEFEHTFPTANKVILNQNYRSHHPIVATANKVIAKNRKRFSKELIAQKDSDSYPLLFFPYDEEEEATMIVQDIKNKIQNGGKPSDFSVLYRTNTHARALFERFLYSNIPFSLDQSHESFYQKKMVRKILAFLRLAINEDDMLSASDLASALFIKQDLIQQIKALSITENCTIIEAFSRLDSVMPFQKKRLQSLPAQFKTLKTLAPVQAIQFIEKEMGIKDYIKKQGNEGNKMERGSDDVKDLKIAAKSFQSTSDFIEHVDHIIAKYEEQRKQPIIKEAVQLSTIHRAKGLEFLHVYILGSVEGNIPHDYALDAWREGDDGPIEEERRLMYVAMTRAIESLTISVPMNRREASTQKSRFLKDAQRKLFNPKTRDRQIILGEK